jgi:ribosomal protein S18 acetylase RimI-like enzyme
MNRPVYVQKKGLDEKELSDIRDLAAICEKHDGIRLKLNWDLLQERPSHETNDFLCYMDEKLVGFAGLYGFGREEIELSGMVHPDYRQRRIFRSLAELALAAASERSIANLIFIVPQDAAPGLAAANSFRASYSFSEYIMELTEPCPDLPRDPSVRLVESGPNDFGLLVRINAEGFGMKPDESREFLHTVLAGPGAGSYSIAYLDREPAGILRVQKEPGEAFIYGFCVIPSLRGRGIGRNILAQAVEKIREDEKRRILLEVECENRNALGLYESVGFRIIQALDYHVTRLS